MLKLINLGLLSGLFFSATFVLNEIMSEQGGHWFWSASLRYLFMVIFLLIIALLSDGIKQLKQLLQLFLQHAVFWIVTGSIGFGAFYALICFSADYSPGWIIAATWQFTIVASLLVLMLFGRRFPSRVWLFSTMIFFGVLLINLSQATEVSINQLLFGALPVLLAAFCYPLGNQLVWEVRQGQHKKLPKIHSPLLDKAFNKVLLMSLGSIPMWIVLGLFVQPGLPEKSQILNTALVALFSGVIATSIFIYARTKATKASELAGVDATQASEVVFAMIAGLILLNSVQINLLAICGLAFVFIGLGFFVLYQNRP
ncbi:conserved hypothetical protein [Psychromonas ingrahamii 37]|uniref:Multidrug resistance efflux transporter family protein n=1 Tax=Psychromonas ingrahamii (strain DSM 17664 / CCUG 51855 / 37) TaxID=357804 RepID=A1SUW4_PSYIN|nr:multidrug resistance efflux transporter family protein [Psychromonas ingrahamii]ABM03279.1 conserved hypothetical protein [Psychromonas ingrahamii 37]